MLKIHRLFILSLLILATSCASKKLVEVQIPANLSCEQKLKEIKSFDVQFQLNSVNYLYQTEYFNQVIELSQEILRNNRDQYYSVFKDTAEVLFPEGTFKDYILEKHERTFLALMTSL